MRCSVWRIVVVAAVVAAVAAAKRAPKFTFDDLAFCAERLADIVHVPTKSATSPTIVDLHEQFVALLQAEGQLPGRLRFTKNFDVMPETTGRPGEGGADGNAGDANASSTWPAKHSASGSGSVSQEQPPPTSVFAPPPSDSSAASTGAPNDEKSSAPQPAANASAEQSAAVRPRRPMLRDHPSLAGLRRPTRIHPDAYGNAAAPFWRIERSRETALRCAFLRNVSSLAEARRQVLGIDDSWELLGYGGTPGGIDRSAGPQGPVDPPLPAKPPKRITETVITHFGASPVLRPFQIAVNLLLLRPPKTTFLAAAKTLKAKGVVERSASFLDRRTHTVHIARIRWVALFYMETAPEKLRAVVSAYADHDVKDAASGRSYPVRAAEDIVGGYVAMSAGTWDMSYMNGKHTPGIRGSRNETEAMIAWKRQAGVFAEALDAALKQTATVGAVASARAAEATANSSTASVTVTTFPPNVLFRTPLMWRDQPLPRCESHRYSRKSKLAMRCEPVLKPILVPFYRNTIRAALRPVGVLFLPVDYLIQPLSTPASSSARAPTLPPPPWFDKEEVEQGDLHKYLSPLHDGVHLEPPGMYLELTVYWAFAARWGDTARRLHGAGGAPSAPHMEASEDVTTTSVPPPPPLQGPTTTAASPYDSADPPPPPRPPASPAPAESTGAPVSIRSLPPRPSQHVEAIPAAADGAVSVELMHGVQPDAGRGVSDADADTRPRIGLVHADMLQLLALGAIVGWLVFMLRMAGDRR